MITRLCESSHHGVDWAQLRVAVEEWAVEDKPLRGASTLSMQTTKNALLWPGRSYLRKAMELPLTPALELLWGKRRVLEVYLNIAEMGPGVFGIEAAAQHHFNKPASELSRSEVARIAAIMPNPLERSPVKPSTYTRERGRTIEKGIGVVDVGCTGEVCSVLSSCLSARWCAKSLWPFLQIPGCWHSAHHRESGAGGTTREEYRITEPAVPGGVSSRTLSDARGMTPQAVGHT